MDRAEFRINEMFGRVGAFGPWGLDAHLARSPFMAAAGEGMAALQDEHHAALLNNRCGFSDDAALTVFNARLVVGNTTGSGR